MLEHLTEQEKAYIAGIIETVRPYMIVKALQADVLLDFPMTKNGVRKLTAEEELQQAIDYIRLKDLNKTGRRKEE